MNQLKGESKSGYLKVDGIHSIYYEEHGNESGETILFIHGGPGIGCSKRDLQFFDLNAVNVILFDQRGCGKSIPKQELDENTTPRIIQDINNLLVHLKKERVYLFGGSWGSTVALLFAIKNPEKVKGMILRGVFAATREEREFFETGGIRSIFRNKWERYESKVPDEYKKDVSTYYFRKILNGNKYEQKELAYELNYYGISVSSMDSDTKKIRSKLEKSDYLTRAILLSHYSLNNFFMPDNYIWDNIKCINNIRIMIIHGRNDYVTLPKYAVRLHSQLKRAKLHLVNGGHSPFDKELKEQLMKSVNELINETGGNNGYMPCR
ncbi:MAG: alpha/beta fold hydrolase [bacterium]|uniref:alpha/beta fold hydrolase n=1 Tax=Phaeodactylibacter xiamenensis TaxID=1524460 RepID=UPI0005C7267B|nr:alpha/beta fold hydrolase [Phaeodactylibacter xiamenensis]MCR9055642.1 alpha/beta fold hydrolase [bacterium]